MRAAVHSGVAMRIPLIRDETGTVLVGAAFWLPDGPFEKGERPIKLSGEAVVDDTVLFDGEVTAVRIEPTADHAGAARQRAVGPDAAEALGRRPRRAAGHPGCDRGARRSAGSAAGSAFDVLSTHTRAGCGFGSFMR